MNLINLYFLEAFDWPQNKNESHNSNAFNQN